MRDLRRKPGEIGRSYAPKVKDYQPHEKTDPLTRIVRFIR